MRHRLVGIRGATGQSNDSPSRLDQAPLTNYPRRKPRQAQE